MNDEEFSIVEEQLRDEARRLLVPENRREELWAACMVRRRRAVRKSLATMAALGLAIASLATWRHHVGVRPAAVADVKEREPATDRRPARRPAVFTDSVPAGETILVIPFVIGDPASGQQVISGIYVPERVEPIEALDLSPAEHEAVRSVLGIEGGDRPIIQPI